MVFDLSNKTGAIQQYILFTDNEFLLKGIGTFESLKIDSIIGDTIYSIRSDYFHKPFFATNSIPKKFIFKYSESKNVSAGSNVADKLVTKVSYDYFTNKLCFYFLNSDKPTIGVGEKKARFIDTSFTRHFTKADSLCVAPADITNNYRESVFELRYLKKDPFGAVHEKLMVPKDSVRKNFISSLMSR